MKIEFCFGITESLRYNYTESKKWEYLFTFELIFASDYFKSILSFVDHDTRQAD